MADRTVLVFTFSCFFSDEEKSGGYGNIYGYNEKLVKICVSVSLLDDCELAGV
jgi:hypothetical protein